MFCYENTRREAFIMCFNTQRSISTIQRVRLIKINVINSNNLKQKLHHIQPDDYTLDDWEDKLSSRPRNK